MSAIYGYTGLFLEIPIVFTCEEPGDYDGSLSITCNDEDEDQFDIPLVAEAVVPPDITLSLEEITVTLMPDATTETALTISNDGVYPLQFMLSIENPVFLSRYNPGENTRPVTDDIQLRSNKGEVGAAGDPVIYDQGGPDNFGYIWKDSDEPDGPAFEWMDISGLGVNTGCTGDDAAVRINLPFEFPYYGETKDAITIGTNGYLSFAADGGLAYSNDPIPHSDAPNDVLCPFWDDLNSLGGCELFLL